MGIINLKNFFSYTFLYILSIGIPTLIVAIYAPIFFQEFSYSNIEIGFLLFLIALCPFFIPFFFLKFKINTKTILSILALYLSSILCFFLSIHSLIFLSINIIFFSFLQGVLFSYIDGLVMDEFKNYYGKMRGSGSLTFATLSIILATYYSLTIISWLMIIYVILFAILFLYVVLYIPHHEKHSKIELKKEFFFAEKKLWLTIILVNLGMGAFYAFFGIFLLDHNYSVKDLSYLWTISTISEIIFMFKQETVGKYISSINLIKLAILATIIRFIIVYIGYEHIYLLYFTQVLHFFSYAMFNYGIMKLLADKYCDYIQPKIQIYRSFLGLGVALGSLLGGFIYGYYFFLIITFIFIIALFVFSKK